MHNRANYSVPIGGTVVCGSRKLRLDGADEEFTELTLTLLKGETVEVRDPVQRDNPWIFDDPGEGDMVEQNLHAKIGHKIRVGNHRQFRVKSFDGTNANIVVIGPDSEI